MKRVIFRDLGRIPYREAWDLQEELSEELIERKKRNREHEKAGRAIEDQYHYLLFCEHPPVYTLGKSGSIAHLLLDEQALEAGGFEFFKINRGGDITYHGPGQIVGYPIFDLDCFFRDVHRYVRYLEEAVIRTLADYDLEARRMKGYTGVWMDAAEGLPKRKICAIGVHLSRWVTMHGFAFNVNPKLQHFNHIIPCGINDADKAVTSMEQELGRPVDMEHVKTKLKFHFAELFGFEWMPAAPQTIRQTKKS
jgi:lipoyl(octanoyl) transferase